MQFFSAIVTKVNLKTYFIKETKIKFWAAAFGGAGANNDRWGDGKPTWVSYYHGVIFVVNLSMLEAYIYSTTTKICQKCHKLKTCVMYLKGQFLFSQKKFRIFHKSWIFKFVEYIGAAVPFGWSWPGKEPRGEVAPVQSPL